MTLPSDANLDANFCTVWLVGDSLMSHKRAGKSPETGWGMPFSQFFTPGVRVENRAVNGHSTKRFLDEGRWSEVSSLLVPGDWLLVQFGHNDESRTRSTATTEDEFGENLRRFVSDAVARHAQPLLLTPVARRRFSADGAVLDTHRYSGTVRRVARQTNVPLLDIDARSRSLLAALGPDTSRLLYLHLAPEVHPNYAAGIADDTHLNELGAREVAQLVLAEMRDLGIALAERVAWR